MLIHVETLANHTQLCIKLSPGIFLSGKDMRIAVLDYDTKKKLIFGMDEANKAS